MIVTVTLNPAVDHTIYLPRSLTQGTINRAETEVFQAGGKGVNVAQYLEQLDVPVLATGLVGVENPVGQFFQDELDAQALRSDFVPIDGATRLNTTVLTPDDEYKINTNGPFVDIDDVDGIIDVIARSAPSVISVGGSLPGDLPPAAIDRIAGAGDWPVAVDVGGETLKALREEYAFCKPNREELSRATGLPTDTKKECIAAAECLREMGFQRVIASLGSDGALLVDESNQIHVDAPDVEIVDTVGAGDGLMAGILAAYVDEADPVTMLSTGVEVAGAIVSVLGTTAPELDPLESLLGQVGDHEVNPERER